jgi:hypothetical protein
LSLYYSGDDLVFHGITTSNKSLGATGSILGAYGNTAFGLMDTAGNPVFKIHGNNSRYNNGASFKWYNKSVYTNKKHHRHY